MPTVMTLGIMKQIIEKNDFTENNIMSFIEYN